MFGTKSNQQKGHESTLFCDLSALDEDQRKRHSDLTMELVSKHLEIKELPDGYEMRFPHDKFLFTAIAEWATLESKCCSFLTLAVELEQDRGPIRLRVTGRDGVKEFLTKELRIW